MSGTRPRILIADDDRGAADALGLMLQQLDCDVRVAYSGVQAIAIAAEFLPQLVVLDIIMPGIDGYETATALRGQGWLDDALYVAHTISRDSLVAETVKKLGFHFHVPKPGTLEDFARILIALRAGRALPTQSGAGNIDTARATCG